MGFFNRFFGSTESVARELGHDNKELIKEWEQYVKTVTEKKNLADNFPIDALRLRELIRLGIGDVSHAEIDEEEILKDLKLVKHDQKIKRIHRLQHALEYAEAVYMYVYRLLDKIYAILKAESSLVNAIEKDSNNRKLIKYLQEQISLEILVLQKIRKMNEQHGPYKFIKLYLELIRGETTIKVLDVIAERYFKKMQKIFSNEIPESITYKWVEKVSSSIEDKIHEAVADGLISGHHPDIEFEFVNRPMFVELVRDSIKLLKPRGKVSERMISIFVEDFRQGFNERGLN